MRVFFCAALVGALLMAGPQKLEAHDRYERSVESKACRPQAVTPLALENRLTDCYGFPRNKLKKGEPLDEFIKGAGLLPVPLDNETFFVDTEENNLRFPYLRLEARQFLQHLAVEYYMRFGKRLKVTSLLRPCWYQNELYSTFVKRGWWRRRLTIAHCNAHDPDRRSTHLTGATFDVSRKGMSAKEIFWMEKFLSAYQRAGFIHHFNEGLSGNFHTAVFRSVLSDASGPLLKVEAAPQRKKPAKYKRSP